MTTIKRPGVFDALQSTVQQVTKDVQQEVFDGPIGQAVANPTGWVAKAAKALSLSAFAPAPPPPALKRPLIMVTGLTMQAASYDPLARHLAGNTANGQVVTWVAADHAFHLGGVNGPLAKSSDLSKSKLFQIQYTNVMGAPTDKAPQLAEAFSAIAKATGSADVDVVAHSAGCTDFRLYLDQRSDAQKSAVHVNQAVLIGPASHGTFMGTVGEAVGGPLGVQKAGAQLDLDSGLVKRLNDSWPAQRSQVSGDVTIVGISGAPTPGRGGLRDGDGFMQVDDLGMPNANTVVLKGADPTAAAHLMEVGYSGVIGEVQKRLMK
jgi:pimeloyl-ACP methyl ester carboxylesterase